MKELFKLFFSRIPGHEIILQTEKNVHFYFPTILMEERIITTRHGGTFQGISFKVTKGTRYHICSHHGNILREEALIETSRGF